MRMPARSAQPRRARGSASATPCTRIIRSRISAVLVARTATPVATVAPWSKAMRAATWFAANAVATPRRIAIPRRCGKWALAVLAETVLPLDVARLETAQTRVQAPARGNSEDHRDLARPRRVAQAHGHRVVVRAHVQRVLVRERHVDRGPGPAA